MNRAHLYLLSVWDLELTGFASHGMKKRKAKSSDSDLSSNGPDSMLWETILRSLERHGSLPPRHRANALSVEVTNQVQLPLDPAPANNHAISSHQSVALTCSG